MNDRAGHLNAARAFLAEAGKRRDHPSNRNFYWILIAWAQNARRRAAAVSREPKQEGLFA